MKKPTLEEAIIIIQKSPEGFAKEFFRIHPQTFIDLIPDNLQLNKKPLSKSQKHKKRKQKP